MGTDRSVARTNTIVHLTKYYWGGRLGRSL